MDVVYYRNVRLTAQWNRGLPSMIYRVSDAHRRSGRARCTVRCPRFLAADASSPRLCLREEPSTPGVRMPLAGWLVQE